VLALMDRPRGLAILEPESPHTRGRSPGVTMTAEDTGAVAMVVGVAAAGGTDRQAGIPPPRLRIEADQSTQQLPWQRESVASIVVLRTSIRSAGKRAGTSVRQPHYERQGDVKSGDVFFVEMTDLLPNSLSSDRHRLVGHHLGLGS